MATNYRTSSQSTNNELQRSDNMSDKMTKTGSTDIVHDYGDDAGKGYEGQTNDDIIIPTVVVLQQMSPQVEGGDGVAGQLYNTVTEESYDEILAVPAFTKREFVEFVPRTEGGGFRGVHEPDSPVVKAAIKASTEFGKYKTPEGNELVETYSVFWSQVDASGEPIGMFTMPFTSMKIKVYKKWNTRVRSFQIPSSSGRISPPLFANCVKLTTSKEKNNKGTFHNPVLTPANGTLKESLVAPNSAAFVAAKQLGELVKSGVATAARTDNDEEEVPF